MSEASPTQPFVSIVLPVYNEAAFIQQTLAALFAQTYPADQLEIIVADGNSTDGTPALVQALAQQHPRLRLIANPERLQAHGLNYAIQAAQGAIIIRMDGHTYPAADYVAECVRLLQTMQAEQVWNVGGGMLPKGQTPAGRAIAAATRSPFGVPSAFHHSQRAQFVDTVYLGAWPRSLFDRIGWFNPQVNLNEDYELNFRLRQAGGQIYFSPTIRSTYFCRPSFAALWRQYHRYGQQKVKMLLQNPAALKPRQVVAPLFVELLVGLPLLGLAWSSAWGVWALMLLAYAGGALLAAYYAPREAVSVGLTAWVFPVLHIAWGTGFWRGLFRHLLSRKL